MYNRYLAAAAADTPPLHNGAPRAVSRTDKVRIFDPETFQKKRAWATDYRKYHDLWIPDNKLTAMWVNIKQAKAGVGG